MPLIENARVRPFSRSQEALFAHPNYEETAEEVWKHTIERMHEDLLEQHGRASYPRAKKWLREALLQYVDVDYKNMAHGA